MTGKNGGVAWWPNSAPTTAGESTTRPYFDQLTRQSPAFRQYWRKQAVLRREGGERRFNHPTEGPRRFLQSTLVLASAPRIKLVSLVPVPEPLRAC